MVKPKKFVDYLFDVCHNNVNAKNLLTPLNIDFKDEFNIRRSYILQVDKCAKIIGKFFFIRDHIDRYIQRVYFIGDNPEKDYYHINDQIDESKIQLIHSILLARLGLNFDAVNILRRALEVAIFGCFFSITSIKINGENKNPFVKFIDKNVYFESLSSIIYSQFTKFICDIKREQSLSEADAANFVLNNFTHYFLKLCHAKCRDHYNDEKQVVFLLEPKEKIKCTTPGCPNITSQVIIDRIVATNLMMRVIECKLQRKCDSYTSLIKLYRKLSRYVHPNYFYYQHIPSFDNENVKEWLVLLKITVNTLTWLYLKTILYIGCQVNNSESILELKNYDLTRIRIATLKKTIHKNLEDKLLVREQRKKACSRNAK